MLVQSGEVDAEAVRTINEVTTATPHPPSLSSSPDHLASQSNQGAAAGHNGKQVHGVGHGSAFLAGLLVSGLRPQW